MYRPELIVERQVLAYNARDLNMFVACHHPAVELYQYHAQEPFGLGRKDVQRIYKDVFENSPELHSEVTQRIIQDNIVIDKEIISGRKGRDTFEMVAIYEIEDGLIKRARFIMP